MARESAGLMIPFTLGIAGASYSLTWLYNHPEAMCTASVAALAATLGLALVIAGHNGRLPQNHIYESPWKSRLALALLFVLAGISAGIIAAVPTVRPTLSEPGLIRRCGAAFADFIDSVPYGDRMSNALVKAFLAGDRSGIPGDVRDGFRDAGASHLLALSGLHLSIIYLVFSKLLSVLGNAPRVANLRSVIIILCSGFFTLMTGATPSLTRAFLFILLREAATILRRRNDSIHIFSIALMIQLAASPSSISSVGFQLSYLAMLGIFLIYPPLNGLWDRLVRILDEIAANREQTGGGTGGTSSAAGRTADSEADDDGGAAGRLLSKAMQKVWSLCALSISCQVFTAPAVMAYFGTFPRYFLITNLLCLPLSNLIMIVSLIVLPLQAIGLCPGFLLHLTDLLIRALVFILTTIASL